MNVKSKIESAAITKLIDYLYDDPEKHFSQIMSMVDKVAPADLYPAQRKAVRGAIEKQNNWYQLLLRITELNPDVAKRLITTFVLDGNFNAWPVQEASREKYQCNIPWAILLDPTTACNLHCTGCWAADYGHSLSLTYDEIDSIIEQGKALGTHVYIYTGGEPLVRKADLIKLCEKHQDCAFLSFTNATLIDEEFCQDLERVANFIPSISVEGFESATDARRGEGTFGKVAQAMKLLREHGLPYGVSACYTSQNCESIASEEFVDWIIEQGALFEWIFTFMPIGKDAPVELMASAEQRESLYRFVRAMRDEKPLFTMDFWNDGEFVGGCIAGGRRYLHINAAGDVEPCVFAHYSNANIRDCTLLEALQSPLFMEYYRSQPFNANLLRPCPMLDNAGGLARMVEASGARSTDLMGAESAADLCSKCNDALTAWAPVAQRLWDDEANPSYAHRHSSKAGMDVLDFEKFKALGRDYEAESAAGGRHGA